MILTAAVRTGVDAVRGAVRIACQGGSHAAWWLDHKLGGSPRSVQEHERRREDASE